MLVRNHTLMIAEKEEKIKQGLMKMRNVTGLPPAQAKIIKKALVDREMTQRQLAGVVGMNENYLTDVLNGRKAGTKYLDEIVRVLEISL